MITPEKWLGGNTSAVVTADNIREIQSDARRQTVEDVIEAMESSDTAQRSPFFLREFKKVIQSLVV